LNQKITDEEFIELWKQLGSVAKVAQRTGMAVRAVAKRRRTIEEKNGLALNADANMIGNEQSNLHQRVVEKIGHRNVAEIKDGIVIVFSDAHFWPGDRSLGFTAMIKLIKELQPKMVICNGDAFDGARISRHPPTGWANMPEVADELLACQEMLGEVENTAKAARKNVSLLWNAGNHDTRYSARLAQMAPDYVRIHGTDLKDHFPAWGFAWSTMINDNTMVKHRWHGGQHAPFNNTLKSGKNMVTGHLHKLMVSPYTDYDGRRYGVDCGTLSDFGPTVDKFTYGEDSPFNWAQGFAVLEFDKQGRLLPPALCEVLDGRAYFERKLITWDTKRKTP